MTKILTYCKSHWDAGVASGGLLGVVTMNKFNAAIACLIGVGTLIFIAIRIFIWFLRARITWKNRNNTAFFIKSKDEETET